MVKTSTLLYLVDDLNLPSDMIIDQNPEYAFEDEYLCVLFDLAETDPGDDLVLKTLSKLDQF